MTLPLLALWTYQCLVIRVIDGDTVDVELSMGLHTYRHERIRLTGVNTPELHGPDREAALAAQQFVRDWVVSATTTGSAPFPFLIRTEKADDWGRWLGTIWRVDTGESLSDALLAAGHAVVYTRRTA